MHLGMDGFAQLTLGRRRRLAASIACRGVGLHSGAPITLTLRHKPHIKRQNPGDQVNRDRRKSVEIKSAATGEGVSAEELL